MQKDGNMTDRKLGEAQHKLLQALRAAKAPQEMIDAALEGRYDDFKSDHATPMVLLVQELRERGLEDIAQRAISGEFDGTKADSDAWAASAEGKETFAELVEGR